jgi:hypothetical protein
MRIMKKIRITGPALIALIATLLCTACQTWKAYPGSVVKGDDAVLMVSHSDIVYVAMVDGMRFPQDPQSEFRGPIRLLPGLHHVTFVLDSGIPNPFIVSYIQSGSAITKQIFVEPGKTYVTHHKTAGNRWYVEITEKP